MKKKAVPFKKWAFKTGYEIHSSPAVGHDGTIFIGSSDNIFYAIDKNGNEKWRITSGWPVFSDPVVDQEENVYICLYGVSGDNQTGLYSLNSKGHRRWLFSKASLYDSVAIGKNGTIYVSATTLYALNPNTGKEIWSLITGPISTPVIGLDGTIYVVSWKGIIYAINPDGSKKWSIKKEGLYRQQPAVGLDGRLYLGSPTGDLYAVEPDGSKIVSIFKAGEKVPMSPVIGTDGSLFFGSFDGRLYNVNPELPYNVRSFLTGGPIISTPAIGDDGTVYVGSGDGNLYAVGFNTAEAQLKWKMRIGNSAGSDPVIASDGTLYVGSYDKQLYAIATSSTGPADSPWPMYQHDPNRSGHV